jgi:hypothetical protein
MKFTAKRYFPNGDEEVIEVEADQLYLNEVTGDRILLNTEDGSPVETISDMSIKPRTVVAIFNMEFSIFAQE